MWSQSRILASRACAPCLIASLVVVVPTSDGSSSSSSTSGRRPQTLCEQRQRFSTRAEIQKLRRQKTAMLQQWERDEDGWRELPARAWPAFQPSETQMQQIQQQYAANGCRDSKKSEDDALCRTFAFQIATTLVFYQIDPVTGLQNFTELAKQGHVDSMVACGVILVEGMGVKPDEARAIEWLEKAVKLGSTQACYELGVCYYTGIDGVLEEDATRAFEYFERAAKDNHAGALYMVADCLAEGEGTPKSIAKAVPLFHQAADRGHRYARQRIRELLKNPAYQSDKP